MSLETKRIKELFGYARTLTKRTGCRRHGRPGRWLF